jgi:hypothetical protein
MIFMRKDALRISSYLLFMVSVVLLADGYRREFNAIERRLESQQRDINRLADTLERVVDTMAELAKQNRDR